MAPSQTPMQNKSSPQGYQITNRGYDTLSQDRLQTFLDEPLEEGNRNVMLPDHSKDSKKAAKKAKKQMQDKIDDILQNYDGKGKGPN